MGGGSYSLYSRTVREESAGYKTKSSSEIFKQRNVNSAMNPYGVTLRESRDSVEHPNSVAIIIALDVTGSMGSVPHFLVKEGLPKIMMSIIESGILDPQVLFVAVGDHEYDDSPLQIGQFESSDELLDKWLTDVWLEGGGGPNDGESYSLAHYFAGFHTSIDCMEKRGQKGILFTIGDEPNLKRYPKSKIQGIMGEGQYSDFTAAELIEKAAEKYDVFHIHVKQTGAGSRQSTIDGWKQLLGDHCIPVDRREEIADVIVSAVRNSVKSQNQSQRVTSSNVTSTDDTQTTPDEMLL